MRWNSPNWQVSPGPTPRRARFRSRSSWGCSRRWPSARSTPARWPRRSDATRGATALLANAAAALGLLEKRAGALRFERGTARRFLIASAPEYLGGLILFDEAIFPLWERLENSIRTGSPARTPDMYQRRPEETRRFIRAMDSLVRARGDAPWVAANLDLSGVRAIADVGGGPGTYLIEFLRRFPALKGAILDLPATLRSPVKSSMNAVPRCAPGSIWSNSTIGTRKCPPVFDAVFALQHHPQRRCAANRALIRTCYRGLNRGGIVDNQGSRDECRPDPTRRGRGLFVISAADHAGTRLQLRGDRRMAERSRLCRHQPPSRCPRRRSAPRW